MTPFSQETDCFYALLVDMYLSPTEQVFYTTSWFSIVHNGNTYVPNRYLLMDFTWQDSADDNEGTTSVSFTGEDPIFTNALYNADNDGLPLNVHLAIFASRTLAPIGVLTLHAGRITETSGSMDYTADGKDVFGITVSTRTLSASAKDRPQRTRTSPDDIKIFSPNDQTYDKVGSETGRQLSYKTDPEGDFRT